MSQSTTKRTTHWEQVYTRRRSDEVSWFQAEPELSLALIGRSGVALERPLIDVGGGASLLVDRLLDRGYGDLTVLDLSGAALAASRARLGARANAVHWIEDDLLTLATGRRYALWHDRAVLHFLTDAADRDTYKRILLGHLSDDGVCVFATFSTEGPTRCSGLDVRQYDLARMQALIAPELQVLRVIPELHRTPGGADQHFLYFLCARAAR